MTIRTLFTLIAPFFIIPSLFAQNIEWETNLGGSQRDIARSIVQTSGGGYVVAGYSESSDGDVGGNKGNLDYWIAKIDGSGNLQWEKNLGGDSTDRARAVIQTDDGGFAVAGGSKSSSGDVGGNKGGRDYWMAKLDGNGNLQWEKNFGGSGRDDAYDIVQTFDGGFAIVGSSDSADGDVGGNKGSDDVWLVKLDGNGNLQWEKNFGGSGRDDAHDIVQTFDGGFAIGGSTYSSDGDVSTGNTGAPDAWILKVDDSGVIEWDQSVVDGWANSIIQTDDKGFAISGQNIVASMDVNLLVFKLDSSGSVQWDQAYGDHPDEGNSIVQTQNGNLLTAGHIRLDNNTDVNGWVLMLDDSSGTVKWEEDYGGSERDEAHSIVQTTNGEYAVAGYSSSSDGDVGGNNGSSDYWVLKLGTQPAGLADGKEGPDPRIHPNPTKGQLRIDLGKRSQEAQLIIRDVAGRTIKSQKVEDAQSFRATIDGEPGLYFVELETADGRKEVRKVVKE